MTAIDPVILMKQEVGKAAANLVQSNSVVGLGTGSTTAYAIEYLGARLQSGEISNIVGVPTSFQAQVLARKYGIPLTTLDVIVKLPILRRKLSIVSPIFLSW
jgi:ribose 5-phosphate isomerase A